MIEILKISLIAYMFTALGAEGMIFAPYQKFINKFPDWLCKPLGGCFLCFTGQVCFWFFLITHSYNLIEHLFFVSAGIFCALIYHTIWTVCVNIVKND